MPKKLALTLILVVLAGFPAMAQEDDKLVVSTVSKEHELVDAGCAFWIKNSDPPHGQMFVSAEQVWMNINGRDTRLTDVSDPTSFRVFHYTNGEVLVKLEYGRGKEHEGGFSYAKAKMTLTGYGQKKVLKLEGGCGC